MKRIVAIVLAALAVLLAAGVFAAGCVAEHVASTVFVPRIEARLGAGITYSAFRPGLGAVVVEGVRLAIPEVPEAEVTVRAVRVRFSPWALLAGRVELREVGLEAPRVAFAGRSEGAATRLGAFLDRARRGAGERDAEGPGRTRVRPDLVVSEGELVVEDGRGVHLHVTGIHATLEAAGRLEVGLGAGRLGAEADGPDLIGVGPTRLSGELVAGELAIDEAEMSRPVLRLSAGRRAAELRSAMAALEALLRDLAGGGAAQGDASSPSSRPGWLRRLGSGTTVLVSDGRIDLLREGAELPSMSLEGLDGQLFGGTDREPPALRLSGRAAPGGGSVRFGLSLEEGLPRAHVELASLRLGDFAADLSRRGLAFDERSLVDADLWVRLREGEVAFQGEIAADRLTVTAGLLADEPLAEIRVRLAGAGSMPIGGREITLGLTRLFLNDVEVDLAGRASRSEDHYELDLTAELPTVECARLLDSTPRPLRGALDDLELSGAISGRIRVAVDSRRLADTVLEVSVRNGCQANGRGLLATERLEGPFVQRVLIPATADRPEEVFEFETGPGTASWASLGEISPYMVAAVLTTEDGRFWTHDGFSLREIRRALIRDLEAGWPRFGASTITMQLARNLYLFRGRTGARKLQEAVLTWYLETHLSKEQILALYLNVIEFGPRIHGVRRAAMHYFGREPDDLSPREAVFLAKLLPNPVARHERTYARGELSARWQSMVDRTLQIMLERGHISAEEHRAALAEPIVFRDPDAPRPPRRTWRHRRGGLRQGFDEILDPWDEGEALDGNGGEARIPAPRELED